MGAPTLDAASFDAGGHLPSTLVSSSGGLGWSSVLAREYIDPAEAEEFTTLSSPDLLIVVNLSGAFEIESRKGGGWNRAAYRPGSIGVTAPGRATTLRWRGGHSPPSRSLHLHLSASLLQDTADALGDRRLVADMPDALSFEDPVVSLIAGGIRMAVAECSEDLHADALAQALAFHLVHRPRSRGRSRSERVAAANLIGPVLPRIRDYIHHHLADDVRLDDLARQASVSKFHFLRAFAAETGETPHAYLRRLRMQHASALLRDTDTAVQQIAGDCGYRSAGQFAKSFRRHFGVSPTEYRRGL